MNTGGDSRTGVSWYWFQRLLEGATREQLTAGFGMGVTPYAVHQCMQVAA